MYFSFKDLFFFFSRDLVYTVANKLSTTTLDSKLQLSLVMKIDSLVNRVSRQLQLQAMLPAASCRLNADRLLAARCESRIIVALFIARLYGCRR